MLLNRIVHFIHLVLLAFLVGDVSYRRNNLSSYVVVQLSLLVFEDVGIKRELLVVFGLFWISRRVRIRHLRNGVLLVGYDRGFILLRFGRRIFLLGFVVIVDVMNSPLRRREPFAQLDHLL